MKPNEIQTKHWKRYTGMDREVARQCEWFRVAFQTHAREAGRGALIRANEHAGYTSKSMMSNIVAGNRTPDLKKAIALAHYFGTDLPTFMEYGKSLSEPHYRSKSSPPERIEAHKLLDSILDGKEASRIDMVIRVLEACSVPAKRKAA